MGVLARIPLDGFDPRGAKGLAMAAGQATCSRDAKGVADDTGWTDKAAGARPNSPPEANRGAGK